MLKHKRLGLFSFLCLLLVLATGAVAPGTANGATNDLAPDQLQVGYTSAAEYGGPDKPLVDERGNPVKLRTQSRFGVLINEVQCDPNRTDFLQFWRWDNYREWCFANSGVTTHAAMTGVDYFRSGNNAGAFYYDTGTQCVERTFNRWEQAQIPSVKICIIEIY